MKTQMRYFIVTVALVTVSPTWADDPVPPSGDHTACRAGYPQCIAWWAVGRSCKETGGQVGGGCLRRGHLAGPEDGTWGWDYVGHGWCVSRIFLGWCPECSTQPKSGPYKTEGPHVPDVFSVKPVKRAV